ncbi:hypothetical protein D8I30_10825 [Brevundimonas naejangsanensis]|uniref:Uncharacterized protein n=1 Tax=Brevundimonas naejangsanensis TaxID=588932 RepID=A0A494RGT4_9CAUL|nr:hypothetical protein D8I30_10825 [Brevundimonas naejangsanensis]
MLDSADQSADAILRDKIGKAAKAKIRGSEGVTRRVINETDDQVREFYLRTIIYEEVRSPAWAAPDTLSDKTHQLLIIAVQGTRAALNASDGAMRDRILKRLKPARPVPRAAIEPFVGDDASVLHLSGVHTPTAVKPNSKSLTGSALEHALDPLGDQTFVLSAVRSRPGVPGLVDAKNRPASIGAAPGGGRIWVGRQKSLDDFVATMERVFLHAQTASTSPRFAMLAQQITDVSAVQGAYEIILTPKDLLSEDAVDAADFEFARKWAYDASFEVASPPPGAVPGLSLVVDCTLLGVSLGQADLAVTFIDGMVGLDLTWKDAATSSTKDHHECRRALTDPDIIKIHYESGHAIAQGRCYSSQYTDQPFDWTFQSFQGYDLEKEKPAFTKPQSLSSAIGTNGDNSLFAFVLEKLFVDAAGKPTGWLACDDGSMELADFIHLDPTTKIVTLVHVKASGSAKPDRQASVSDFEIVVSQAVKNLRHLERRPLGAELTKGKGKKIGSAVWKDGVRQKNRDDFLKAIGQLPDRYKKVAMVVQPRLTQAEVTACETLAKGNNRLLRMQQLNTLLLASRLSAMACGAQLVAVVDA